MSQVLEGTASWGSYSPRPSRSVRLLVSRSRRLPSTTTLRRTATGVTISRRSATTVCEDLDRALEHDDEVIGLVALSERDVACGDSVLRPVRAQDCELCGIKRREPPALRQRHAVAALSERTRCLRFNVVGGG